MFSMKCHPSHKCKLVGIWRIPRDAGHFIHRINNEFLHPEPNVRKTRAGGGGYELYEYLCINLWKTRIFRDLKEIRMGVVDF